MKLWKGILLAISLFLLSKASCGAEMGDADSQSERLRTKRQIGITRIDVIPKLPGGGKAPRTCSHFGMLGFRENGYCTLYDSKLGRFTAYCDFTSEPGYAWTLITSLSRHFVRKGSSGKYKRMSYGQDAPLNENSPNWVAFRYSKYRMESIKTFSSHMRFTCSEDGKFIGLKNYNDYARVKLKNLNPFMLNVKKGKCIKTEFVNIRNVSCSDCTVSFAQRKGIRSLHIDPWLSEDHCSFIGASITAVTGEDNFGFYDNHNTNFTCTKHSWSTTQVWFGSALLPTI